MAFTKSPTQDSHNVVRVPVEGSPNLVSGASGSGLRNINCFTLQEKQWNGQPISAIYKREPWTLSTVATGSVTTTGSRGPAVPANNSYNVFFAKGAGIYALYVPSNSVSAALGSGTNFGNGSACTFIDSTNARRIAFLEAYAGNPTNLVAFLEDGTSVTTTNLYGNLLDGNKGLVFIDSYLFACDVSGTRIYNSTVGGVYTTWTSTDFIDAEQYSDLILYLAKHKNYLVVFGQTSIEFFYNNAVEIGSPLARQESYSSRIGMVKPSQNYAVTNASACNSIAEYEDTIYFMGVSEKSSTGLYKIENFKVEEVGLNQWVQGLFNSASLQIRSISACQINNNPHVIVELVIEDGALAYTLAYNTLSDDWWLIEGSDFIPYTNRVGQPFVMISLNNANGYNDSSYVISNPTTDTDGIYLGKADPSFSTSVSSTVYTQVIDFDTNRYKHLARVDAIGDYGANALTLSINFTPNYASSFTSCGSQNALTIGYGNNISWYNLGAPRRFILKYEMTGASQAIHRGFDVEYNIGIS